MQELHAGNLTRKSVRVSGIFKDYQLPKSPLKENLSSVVDNGSSRPIRLRELPEQVPSSNELNNKLSTLKKAPTRIQPSIIEPSDEPSPIQFRVQLRKTSRV